jgi:hypothetical protein
LRNDLIDIRVDLRQLQIAPGKFAAALNSSGKLDARYAESLFPAVIRAGTSAAERAEPQNQQRVLPCYQRRIAAFPH